jgi:hypothetical protein
MMALRLYRCWALRVDPPIMDVSPVRPSYWERARVQAMDEKTSFWPLGA